MQHTLQYNGTKETISITNNGKKAIKANKGYKSLTHSFTVPYDTTKEYQWQIKCVKYATSAHWWFGLQAANRSYDNTYFHNRDLSYGYAANGKVYDCRKSVLGATPGWNMEDILTLLYSPKVKELSISINNQKQAYSCKIKENPEGYKMAITMYAEGDSVELMDFIVIDDDKKKRNNTKMAKQKRSTNDDNGDAEKKESAVSTKRTEVNILYLFFDDIIFLPIQ